jgi:hypothetical protein
MRIAGTLRTIQSIEHPGLENLVMLKLHPTVVDHFEELVQIGPRGNTGQHQLHLSLDEFRETFGIDYSLLVLHKGANESQGVLDRYCALAVTAQSEVLLWWAAESIAKKPVHLLTDIETPVVLT